MNHWTEVCKHIITGWFLLSVFSALGIQVCYAQRGVFIKQEEYGEDWPFTVSAIYLYWPTALAVAKV